MSCSRGTSRLESSSLLQPRSQATGACGEEENHCNWYIPESSWLPLGETGQPVDQCISSGGDKTRVHSHARSSARL